MGQFAPCDSQQLGCTRMPSAEGIIICVAIRSLRMCSARGVPFRTQCLALRLRFPGAGPISHRTLYKYCARSAPPCNNCVARPRPDHPKTKQPKQTWQILRTRAPFYLLSRPAMRPRPARGPFASRSFRNGPFRRKHPCWGHPVAFPNYSYSIETPDAATESILFKTVVEKVKITMDALTHYPVQNRLKLSHAGERELIHPQADYDGYVSLLTEAARETERYIAASGPFEADLSINIAKGKTGTAGSCDYPSKGFIGVMKGVSPLTVKHTSPVDHMSFKKLSSLRLNEWADSKATDAAWRTARADAGTSLKVAKNPGLVTEDALRKHCF